MNKREMVITGILFLLGNFLFAGNYLEKDLLVNSSFVDFIFLDGSFSYISYMQSAGKDGINKENGAVLEKAAGNYPELLNTNSSAVWLWEYKKLVNNETEIISNLNLHNIRRIYIQIKISLLRSFIPFLRQAGNEGIEVFALDGSPENIHDYKVLERDIRALLKHNAENPDAVFTGFQADVEPHVRNDFWINKNEYMEKYIGMLESLRKTAGGKLPVSAVIPFWYDELIVSGKPFSDRIMDIAGETVLMAYRTDFSSITEISQHELKYGEQIGKTVRLGLEVSRLPEETHYIVSGDKLLPYSDKDLILSEIVTYLGKGIPVINQYTVSSGNISFFGNPEKLEEVIRKKPGVKSFGGYVLHSYEALESSIWK